MKIFGQELFPVLEKCSAQKQGFPFPIVFPLRSISAEITKDPVTIITEKQTYPNVTLPYTVQVDRHKIDGQRIKIQSETKDYRDVVLQKKINSWTWGNILIGGLIGWSIDLITNCVAKPDKPNYIIEERSK